MYQLKWIKAEQEEHRFTYMDCEAFEISVLCDCRCFLAEAWKNLSLFAGVCVLHVGFDIFSWVLAITAR